ncbi:MAG: hypothetical protein DWQ37_06595 [Planctomycetota bacterium]|nr:MAG: hypothetical protein DWQ37_06595 [Planctomycetota bacterium]
MRDLLHELEEFDTSLKRNEHKFKSTVRRFEIDRRKDLTAKLGPEKRRRIQQRANARSAANNAAFRELRRRATGR